MGHNRTFTGPGPSDADNGKLDLRAGSPPPHYPGSGVGKKKKKRNRSGSDHEASSRGGAGRGDFHGDGSLWFLLVGAYTLHTRRITGRVHGWTMCGTLYLEGATSRGELDWATVG